MKRLFWLMVGMGLGVWAYRRYQQRGLEGLGLGELSEGSTRLTERSQEFMDSGRLFADSGKQLVDEGKQFAQTAVETAQMRGRAVVDKVKSQTGMGDKDLSEAARGIAGSVAAAAQDTAKQAQQHGRAVAEETKQGGANLERMKSHAQSLATDLKDTSQRLSEDVREEAGGDSANR
jgi:hypothetical protein